MFPLSHIDLSFIHPGTCHKPVVREWPGLTQQVWRNKSLLNIFPFPLEFNVRPWQLARAQNVRSLALSLSLSSPSNELARALATDSHLLQFTKVHPTQPILQGRMIRLLCFIAATLPPPAPLVRMPINCLYIRAVDSCSLFVPRRACAYVVSSLCWLSPRSWKALLAAVNPDTSPLPRRFYRPAMIVMGTLHVVLGSAIGVKFLAVFGGKPSKV